MISTSDELGLLPPPLWGRVGEGVVRMANGGAQSRDPHPQRIPTRGRGVHRVRGLTMLRALTTCSKQLRCVVHYGIELISADARRATSMRGHPRPAAGAGTPARA